MHTAHLLTVSQSIPCISVGSPKLPWRQTPLNADLTPDAVPPGCISPLDANPLPWRQTPLDADPPVMWHVMHAGKPTPVPVDRQTPVKILPIPKLLLRAVKRNFCTQSQFSPQIYTVVKFSAFLRSYISLGNWSLDSKWMVSWFVPLRNKRQDSGTAVNFSVAEKEYWYAKEVSILEGPLLLINILFDSPSSK